MTGARSNWKEISLGELGKWITGSTPKSSNPLNFGNDVDFVTPSDIGYGGLLGPSERKISHLGASSVRKVKAPSVNLVCIGTIGKVALARRDVTTNQQINSLEVDKSVVDPNFVMWLLSSPEIQEKLWESASSTTVAILNKGNLEKIKTHIPPLSEQQKIVEILEDHLSRLDAALADVKQAKLKAAQFRRSLLQAAFTGNLTGDGTHLMTKWQNKTLGEIVSIKTGKIDANKAVENGKYPFFTCAREISRIDDAPYEGKVVLVAGNGDLNVKYHEGKFNAYQRTYFITSLDESNALPKYIYFFMEHYLQILRTQSIGTTVKYIKMENLSDASIPFPTIVEQHKIVELLEDHLSRLDASVAIADAMEKQSASLRRSLLQAAFTGQLTKEVASV